MSNTTSSQHVDVTPLKQQLGPARKFHLRGASDQTEVTFWGWLVASADGLPGSDGGYLRLRVYMSTAGLVRVAADDSLEPEYVDLDEAAKNESPFYYDFENSFLFLSPGHPSFESALHEPQHGLAGFFYPSWQNRKVFEDIEAQLRQHMKPTYD